MKAFKITLAVVVVAVIGFCVVLFTGKSPDEIAPLKLSNNPWIKDIQLDINNVLPNQTSFVNARKCYKNVQVRIDDAYKNKRLCDNINDDASNETNRRLLSERLYALYFKKFVELTFNVFRNSEWKTDDLSFIENEINLLQSSSYFDNNGYQGNTFKEIRTILRKYQEITSFIRDCKGFSYTSSSLSDRFPISVVQAKISRAATYQNNQLENVNVNNCSRLKDGLKEIPQVLFRANVRYLDNKISQWSGLYPKYISHKDYSNNLYKPLKSEIDAFDNEIYKASNFDAESQKLLDRWSADNVRAYNYKY